MGGGCSAITGNIREKINMCNLGFLSIHGWGSAMCKTKKKQKKQSERERKSLNFHAFRRTLPHCLMFYIVSPFHGTASEQGPFPPYCTALPNCCPITAHRGTVHNHPPSRDLTSVLGDVAHPRQGLVAALLNDLQVTHLLKGEGKRRGGLWVSSVNQFHLLFDSLRGDWALRVTQRQRCVCQCNVSSASSANSAGASAKRSPPAVTLEAL